MTPCTNAEYTIRFVDETGENGDIGAKGRRGAEASRHINRGAALVRNLETHNLYHLGGASSKKVRDISIYRARKGAERAWQRWTSGSDTHDEHDDEGPCNSRGVLENLDDSTRSAGSWHSNKQNIPKRSYTVKGKKKKLMVVRVMYTIMISARKAPDGKLQSLTHPQNEERIHRTARTRGGKTRRSPALPQKVSGSDSPSATRVRRGVDEGGRAPLREQP